MKKIKEPTDSLKEYYKNLFKRNQNKWMRRSKLEESHIGSLFILEGEQYELLGAIDTSQVLVKSSDNSFYMAHIDDVTKSILGVES